MVFQVTKWGWKRIAARLLLVPVLAGASAAAAHAQQRSLLGSAPPARPAAGPVMTGADPKVMLKEGRKALAEGRYNDAQDLARRAEASNPNGKWGLFDDTPNALLKDVQAAVAKGQKGEGDQLVKQAKVLLARPAASDAERAANLDTALQMAHRADQLHGPYSVWELGDRPDKVVKEIEAARARLRTLPPSPAAALAGVPGGQQGTGVRPAVATTAQGAPSGVTTAGGTRTPGGVMQLGGTKTPAGPAPLPTNPYATPAAKTTTAGATDAKKTAAMRLVAEGDQLVTRGDFVGAKAKYVEADKLGAAFAPADHDPGTATQELNARGAAAIAGLVQDARAQVSKKDYAKADAALTAAAEIAAALSLYPRPIEEAKTALRMASGGKFGGVPPGGLAAADGPETLVPLGSAPVEPPAPPGVATVGGPAPFPVAAAKTPTPSPAGGVNGRQLMDQAQVSFQHGDLDAAERIARQAFNAGGVQDDARGLLNTIDAERLLMKKRTAEKSFEAAAESAKNRDHGHAFGVLVLIDPNLLPADQRAKHAELMAACKAEVDKANGLVAAGGAQPPGGDLQPLPTGTPPGTARVGDARPGGADNLANQADALRKATFQKLRGEGLKVTADAQATFGKGDTDVAIQMLTEYANRVRAANLEPTSTTLLLRPVESRLEMFRVMKGQNAALTRERTEKAEAKAMIAGRGVAEEQRKAEVTKLVREYHGLAKAGKYAEAERVAMVAKQLDPDDPAIEALAHMAKTTRRVKEYEAIKDNKEKFFLGGMNDAEKMGPLLSSENPVEFQIQRNQLARGRGRGDDAYLRTRTQKEFEIELQLDKPITVEFNQTPLSEVIENLRTMTALPFSYDTAALEAEAVSTARPITEKLPGVSTRNALHLILDKAGLSFVIEYDTVRITTLKKAKGRLVTKVFSVTDLVTPIPNFALPDYANIEKMFSRDIRNSPNALIQGLNTPGSGSPPNGLAGGQPVAPGAAATTPGMVGNVSFGPRGSLENNPLAASSNMATSQNATKHEQLIRLITGMVRPYSWDGMGGPGRIEFFDLGAALVVNQTADVISEIRDLLEALRRLQDLAVAVEVRIISLSETWFERMGVDFAVNVKTNNSSFERSVASQQFRPEPFLNSLNGQSATVGLTPAGAGSGAGVSPSFTPDLNVPVRATSFNYAIPGFGGYPNNPGFNGGVSLGLAFLNDLQVYLFMEAAQGDRRVNVMTAPKLTLFNGQTATIAINEQQFIVTNVQVYSVNGQIVFVPQNTPLPGPGDPLQGGSINIGLQAVVSADRRFVRINIPVTLAAQTGASVPLFPFTTFITPVFEGGSQGVPIPFTQFLQQPSFTTLNIQTTVVAPDGGTVLLGGLKALGEGRNEFGPPFLSKVPYLNRLFKNVGIGRDTKHIMIMITPRIIINSEEEINQTEGGGPLGTAGPGR